jgi:hypothetical protein
MIKRGRPAQILSSQDINNLKLFLEELPFLRKNQQQALSLLQELKDVFDIKQLSLLKTVDREKRQFVQRLNLAEQIKIKHQNQQKLLANETEIFELLAKQPDRETFFRLDRALESYQKIRNAALENRIRLENEQRREIIHKHSKQLTEAAKKRNAENQLKYALGGTVLAVWKKMNIPTEDIEPFKVQNMLINNLRFVQRVRSTQFFKDIEKVTQNFAKSRELFPQIIDALTEYRHQGEQIHLIELKKKYPTK